MWKWGDQEKSGMSPNPRPPSSKIRSSFKSEPEETNKQQGIPCSAMGLHPVSAKGAIVHSSARPPFLRTEARNNAWEKETSWRLPRKWQSGRPGPSRPLPACQLLQNHFFEPRSPTRGTPDAALRAPSGLPPASPGVWAPSRAAVPAPSLPVLPVPVPVRSRNHAAGSRASLVPALNISCPGPRSLRARYSPPTRYMLAAMAVPAAASGRTKGSGRLGGAGLGSRRSPERGAGTSRKSESGPRSRHLRRLSRRGSSRPALSPPLLSPHTRDAEAGAGLLGFFRNELGS